jgi:4-amino-4-deoxy-L-arabinose transferase-like glycosyltransferase
VQQRSDFRKGFAFLLVILVLSYLFLFFNLGAYSLKEPDEGRYAEIPREMVEQGRYVVPYLNYVRYFEKPPLLYWLTAASYKVFGIDEWSFRLPNALAALLCVLTTFFFVSRWKSVRAALISSVILLSSFGFFAMGRIVTIDMLFTFMLFAALSCFYEYYRDRKTFFLYLFYLLLALAVLAKGPVAIVLIGLTILIFLTLEKQLFFARNLLSLKGLVLFVTLAAPWFIAMSVREKEFFQFFFIDQHVLRFLTTKHHRSGPIYYFIPVLLAGLFPWPVFVPRAIIRFWHNKEIRLFLVWSLLVFVFFTVSGSKLPPYILPLFPTLAILLGSLFDTGWKERMGPWETAIYLLLLSVFVLGGFLFSTGIADGYLRSMPKVLSLSRDVRGLVLGVSFVSLIVLVTLTLPKWRAFGVVFFNLCALSLSIAVGLMLHAHVIDQFRTTKQLAGTIKEMARDPVVVSYRSFDETLPFYLMTRTYLAEETGELQMGSKYLDSKGFFLGRDELAQMIRSDKPVFVVVKVKRIEELLEIGVSEDNLILCQDERCLMANSAALSSRTAVGAR